MKLNRLNVFYPGRRESEIKDALENMPDIETMDIGKHRGMITLILFSDFI